MYQGLAEALVSVGRPAGLLSSERALTILLSVLAHPRCQRVYPGRVSALTIPVGAVSVLPGGVWGEDSCH